MKPFFIKLLLFILLFISLDFTLGIFLNKMYLNVKTSKIYNSNHGFTNSSEKIILLGASEMSHHLISNKIHDKTNLSCYNYGMDGCGIFYQYPLLQSILEKNKPKILVISTTQILEFNREYLTKLYPYYNNNKHVRKIIDSISPKEGIKLNLYGYTYNSSILEIFKGNFSNMDSLNGYCPLYGSVKDLKLKNVPSTPISKETLHYFQKFIQLAKLNGITVYVFVAPRYQIIDNKKQIRFIDSLCKSERVKFLDYSQDQDFMLHPELFKDSSHLNDLGANILTDKFINQLKSDKF